MRQRNRSFWVCHSVWAFIKPEPTLNERKKRGFGVHSPCPFGSAQNDAPSPGRATRGWPQSGAMRHGRRDLFAACSSRCPYTQLRVVWAGLGRPPERFGIRADAAVSAPCQAGAAKTGRNGGSPPPAFRPARTRIPASREAPEPPGSPFHPRRRRPAFVFRSSLARFREETFRWGLFGGRAILRAIDSSGIRTKVKLAERPLTRCGRWPAIPTNTISRRATE